MNPTLSRLRDAINAHDPADKVALIAPEYRR